MVSSGRLLNSLEEEAGTTEVITVGHLVGEYGLLTAHKRFSTLTAVEPSTVFQLDRANYERLGREHPELVLVLSKICIVR